MKFVLHVGGMTYDHPATEPEKDAMYERLAQSMEESTTKAWSASRKSAAHPLVQRRSVALECLHRRGADRELLRRPGYKMCYDTSHAQLFCNHVGIRQVDYFKELKHLVRHSMFRRLWRRREGLQIGDGDVDFTRSVADTARHRRIVHPEIWMGHKEDGEDFWVALHRLRAFGF